MTRKEAMLLSRKLRKNQTAAEGIIWEKVRNRRLLGLKFSRQYPIEYANNSFFIVDFHCHQLKLIIEIDGEIHNYKKPYDQGRENILTAMGFIVLRYENIDVFNKTEEVVQKMKNEILGLSQR